MAAVPSDKVDVTIRVGREDASRFDEIVRLLERMGLSDAAPHPRFGIVNGTVASSQVEVLQHVAGVASVREDRSYRAQAD